MRRLSVSLFFLMLLFSITWSQTALDLGQVWQNQSEEPLIYTIGDSGAWNGSGDMWDWNWGHVLQDADTFKLYIGGSDGTNFSIGMWHTMDLESGWTEYIGNPVLQRSATGWDSCHVGGPMVIKDGDTYKMWYTGAAHLPTHGRNKTIGYATSTDGVNWDKHPSPVIDPGPFVGVTEYVWIRNPFVIHEADTFKMWMGVSKVDPTYESIHYGYSLDGINWVFPSDEPVLAPKANRWLDIPSVQKIDGQYVMWLAEGGYGAGYGTETIMAKSSDGIHWRRDELYNPVLRRHGTGGFGDTGVGIYDVIATDEGYSALYGGWGANLETHVGLAKYNPTIIPAGDVSGAWTKTGSPYRVLGDITIPDRESLSIEPGTIIQFLERDQLIVHGQLVAEGSQDDPIKFMTDDTLGFGTLNSSDGVWDGIYFDGPAASNDSSRLKHCEIAYAKTFSNTFNYGGGGLTIRNFSKLRVENSFIHHNRVISNIADGVAMGGGVLIYSGSSPEFIGNTISHNLGKGLLANSSGEGGGIGIYDDSHPLIKNNIIRNNLATDTGGGLAIWEDSYPLVVGNLLVENIALSNNAVFGFGGGVSIGWDAKPTLINNTIADNQAGWGGGGVYFNAGYGTFINTIIADNIRINSTESEAWGHDMATWGNTMADRTLDLQNSCLEGGPDLIMWGVGNTGTPGTVNFVESLPFDPHLNYNYTLSSSRSPCIGSGTASCVIDDVTYQALSPDMNGHSCPDPAGSSPDMGAFESHLSVHRITSYWHWYEWSANPVFSPGEAGTYDDEKVFAPDVLFFEGEYHMWYVADDGLRFTIGHATSIDGVEWLRDPANPILTSDPDSWHDSDLNVPRVVIIEDVFHMWFHSNNRAGHATSTDGIEWTFTSGPVLEGDLGEWDGDQVFISDVIYLDTLFHAWYSGNHNGIWGIGHATSTDGIEWVKDVEINPVFGPSDSGWDSGMFYASSVVYNGEYFYLWYCAKENNEPNRIGRATSFDGINWIRTTANEPEIGYGEPGSWNAAASFYPAVVLNQGEYEIWYNGVATILSGWTIGYASMVPTAVETGYVEAPQTFMLSQNYPNPFNPMTHIRYSLPENGDIRLVIYDLLGREVIELVNDFRNVGNYETTWYGINKNGEQVSTGVYFARLEADRNVDVIKMLFLK
ncbi:MAG: right-handed parallel beta-helix repeat-containing protein [Candidatus Marinimicrobia bacterium]|nr:right-handed parallel beta-helix repeat-containing protein [Candidatus Neomarinimicrobiota bacterium]